MKNLKILFSVLLLAVFVISCSSDSDNSPKVKYQIAEIDNSITEIRYTKSNGDTQILTDWTEFAGTNGDSKTVNASDIPFNAELQITVNNVTPSVKTYTLVIYVDGEIADFTPMSVPPMTTTTGEVDYIVEP
jgi:hypothetical protein